MILARPRALEHMKSQGIVPTHKVPDNEISTAYRLEIENTSMNYQLVPPDDHRRNLAEKSIKTCKDHFIRTMSRKEEIFPAHLWCQAIPQAKRQLLLLRKSNVNPKISAHDYVYEPHDYNAAHFVTIGMETLVYDNPKIRRTFAEHCSKGFVLVTAFENYRSWIMWMENNRATRISATVFHKHKYITNPDITTEDRVIAVAGKLVDTLKGCMSPHLSEKTSNNWSASGPSSRMSRPRQFSPTCPGHPPILLHPYHRTHPTYILVQVATTPAPLTTPFTSSTVPPPRVVTPPRVPPKTVAPPPRGVTPLTVAHQVPLRHSP